jgi:SAM-dependent methyltransferase
VTTDNVAGMREAGPPAEAYDAYYYANCLGNEPCDRENPVWTAFFGSLADAIVADLRPQTVLDAGCGIGLLVECLRDRKVDAWGIDVSEYALGRVRSDLRPHCRAASVEDELDRVYDLIVCIEVLEHLPPRGGDSAVGNFTRHADAVLFSSTPDDFREATHVNVQPTDYWVGLFARRGFYRDFDFDASFIAPQAVLFRRTDGTPYAAMRGYERNYWRAESELRELRAEVQRLRAELAGAGVRARVPRKLARLRARLR